MTCRSRHFLFLVLRFILIHFCLSEEETPLDENGYTLTAKSYDYTRPEFPLAGTVNWEKLESNGRSKFSPRHSHATCVFQCPHQNDRKCIWLTGGRTEPYRTFNLQTEDRTADVWWTEDGNLWNKVMELRGDFVDGIGNFDAKENSDVAPWYSRYGHSLDTMDTDGNGEDDIMVLMGGFNPIPSNDVWISPDGLSWYFERYAVWSERAYHATAVFQNELWVMGGTPLSNDVWSGRFIKDFRERSGYRIDWRLRVQNGKGLWAPRCGMCVLTQLRKIYVTNSNETKYHLQDHMYLIGGFAGWPRGDPRWNGDRTRNDVWITTDGLEWSRVLPPEDQNTMPFVGRGWHACATWHDVNDRSRGVTLRSSKEVDAGGEQIQSKLYLSGGGYMGTKGNSDVRTLEGYVDLWWSYNGSMWFKVNHEQGEKRSLYSTNEWTSTDEDDPYHHRGKWGHSLVSFFVKEDLNLDGDISTGSIPIEFCARENSESDEKTSYCEEYSVNEEGVPSLFVIGGDTTNGGPIVNNVYISKPGLHCELEGVTCNNAGSCGPSTIGCICNSEEFSGEYCDFKNDSDRSGGGLRKIEQSWLLMICGGAILILFSTSS